MYRAATLLIAMGAAVFRIRWGALSMREYEERCASYYARQYDVLASSCARRHSGRVRVAAGSRLSKGAMGLMQLMPATAEHFGVTHPFYIHENVRGGVAYLAELQKLFHGDLRLMIAAYAAGEKPILARGLNYSSEEVYTHVQRIAQQYRAELRRKGGR